MLALAAGLAVVPAIGSQGAGALGARSLHADAALVGRSADAVEKLRLADSLVEQQVLALDRR
jgi:hypothetical protein